MIRRIMTTEEMIAGKPRASGDDPRIVSDTADGMV